ncbi:MAG: T9SS type A sorting domain-containing protein [Bacteroidota bacterium]
MALQINEEEELQLDIRTKLLPSILTGLLIHFAAPVISQTEECTIGVACGAATQDGRPMIWKTRDYLDEPDNEVRYDNYMKYRFIYVAGADSRTSARMGVNEHGLAIVNSNTTDLPDGSDTGPLNGQLIKNSLGNCRTIEDFQAYLDETNQTGRRTNGCFATIDSTGAAALFEVGELAYWRFDATDDPTGYVLRTNFSINGGGSSGRERLIRSVALVGGFHRGDSLNHRSILRHQMRDFSDNGSNPFPIPFNGALGGNPHGYIETTKSICRNSSVSASVITGVLPGEFPELSTMWTILGQPGSSIALPYWPIGYTPHESDGVITSQLCDVANQIKQHLFDDPGDKDCIDTYKLLDGEGGGLWTRTFPYEDTIFAGTELLLEEWREEEELPVTDMKALEDSLALKTYHYLQSCLGYILTDPPVTALPGYHSRVFPNPFNTESMLTYELSERSDVNIRVFTLTGALLESVRFTDKSPGEYSHTLGGDGTLYPDGILLVKLTINNRTETLKVIKTPR